MVVMGGPPRPNRANEIAAYLSTFLAGPMSGPESDPGLYWKGE